jgi:tryptophan synthase alpha chain
MNKHNAAPALLGFGISTPEQVKSAIEAGAAGAISGSATVNIIAANLDDTDAMLTSLGSFVQAMKAATVKG